MRYRIVRRNGRYWPQEKMFIGWFDLSVGYVAEGDYEGHWEYSAATMKGAMEAVDRRKGYALKGEDAKRRAKLPTEVVWESKP